MDVMIWNLLLVLAFVAGMLFMKFVCWIKGIMEEAFVHEIMKENKIEGLIP